MKVLYLSYSIPKPNLPQSIFVYNRIKELIRQGVQVVPVTFSNLYSSYLTKRNFLLIVKNWGRDYNFHDIDLDLNLNVINLKKIEYPGYYINLLFFINLNKIRKTYFENECSLIHAHYVRDGIYAYWLKKKYGLPYIITAHAYDILKVPYRNKILREITLKVLENSNKSIFVSEVILEKAKSLGYSSKNATIIPNGYNPEDFFCLPQEMKSKKEKIIGFVGSLIDIKRADFLPVIFYYIKKRIKSAKLYIIGQGYLKNRISSELKKHGLLNEVTFYGNINHKRLGRLYNEMDVLILPSKNEGFPTVIVEALACGVPVVASDCGSNRETLKKCGTVVSQDDDFIENFSEAVINILENPISQIEILNFSKNFTWEILVKKEIDIYKSTLDYQSAV